MEKNYFFQEGVTLEPKRKTINLVKQKGFNEYFSCKTGKGFGATNFSWTAALFLDLILENKND